MRVAILGCGQLARMLAQVAGKLGAECVLVAIEDESVDCVLGLGRVVYWSSGDDPVVLYRALGEPDVVTIERESLDVDLLCALQACCPVMPNPESVRVGQNRRCERELLQALNIPCAPHRVASTQAEARAAVQALGLPLVVKATESGYDGKLQWRLRTVADVEAFFSDESPGECLLEQWVGFDCEVSLVAARSARGEFKTYPLTENVHRDGILLASIAPARVLTANLQRTAMNYARLIMEKLDYVGVMAVEFFVVNGELWVNELAPRVHNSGHWTQCGNTTSQFENHLRALLGMPLGATILGQSAGMFNLLGESAEFDVPARDASLQWHSYNKVPAPGRKMGHVNILTTEESDLLSCLDQLHRTIYGEANSSLEAPPVLNTLNIGGCKEL